MQAISVDVLRQAVRLTSTLVVTDNVRSKESEWTRYGEVNLPSERGRDMCATKRYLRDDNIEEESGGSAMTMITILKNGLCVERKGESGSEIFTSEVRFGAKIYHFTHWIHSLPKSTILAGHTPLRYIFCDSISFRRRTDKMLSLQCHCHAKKGLIKYITQSPNSDFSSTTLFTTCLP